MDHSLLRSCYNVSASLQNVIIYEHQSTPGRYAGMAMRRRAFYEADTAEQQQQHQQQ